ncbi:MAG TPA: GyrI-like domain-containing protein [Ohtaekwangia sp.]|nr:GyrI-like domain-containing protein [Ohtaekwangia sp.]
MNALKHRIETINEIALIGIRMRFSLAANRTAELWQNFMPRRHEIGTTIGNALYSVEVYDDLSYFAAFDPTNQFDKWAGVAVERVEMVPEGMATLLIPAGEYVVFDYKGRPSEVGPTYQFIYGQWLSNSEYKLDDRPHFALMGERYKGEHPDSEEELWIPVVRK